MNLRNKKLVMILRTLFGLFMVFSGVSGFLMGPNPAGTPESMVVPTQVLWDTGIFHMIKATETVSGIMLIVNFLPALAAIFLAPVAIGIIIVNAMMTPQFLPIGLIVALFDIYLGYVYWNKYKPLFDRKHK